MSPEERTIQWIKIGIGLCALACIAYGLYLLHVIAYGI
jgi:hypothetical protein